MFEQYKLNKYRECLVGMAYDVSYNKSIQTYLVIQKNGVYEYIKFYKRITSDYLKLYALLKDMQDSGYKPLSYYIGKNNSKERTLAKSNFVRVK